MEEKRNWISLGLLAFFLLSLLAAILLHWKVSSLEAEQAALVGRTDFESLLEGMDRNNEITRTLHGYRGLYWYQSKATVSLGVSAFLCFCDGMERLKKWIFKVL